jgi:hypothetical protein
MKRTALLVMMAIGIGSPVFAHEIAKGPHGGRVAEGGGVHVELVATTDSIDVYLTDGRDQAVTPNGYKGTAILLVDGKPVRVPLAPQDARLTGKASNLIPADPKGVVQFTAPDGKTGQARFN